MAQLAGIQPETIDTGQIRLGLVQHGHAGFFAEVAQKAHDQARAHAPLRLRRVQRTAYAVVNGGKGNAAVGVRLRVEKDFGVHDAVGVGALEVGPGQVVEVLLGLQHARTGVVQVQKGLQAVELVSITQRVDAGIRQGNAVTRGQGKHQLRLQRAFNMQVQLGFGQRRNQRVYGVGHGGLSARLAAVCGAVIRDSPCQHRIAKQKAPR